MAEREALALVNHPFIINLHYSFQVILFLYLSFRIHKVYTLF